MAGSTNIGASGRNQARRSVRAERQRPLPTTFALLCLRFANQENRRWSRGALNGCAPMALSVISQRGLSVLLSPGAVQPIEPWPDAV